MGERSEESGAQARPRETFQWRPCRAHRPGSRGRALEQIPKRGVYCSGNISYASKDKELAERAGTLMAAVRGKELRYEPYWSRSSRVFVVQDGSKHLAEMLPTVLHDYGVLLWRHRKRFLKGIYDAEGSVTIRQRRDRIYPRVYLTNSNPDIIRTRCEMLESFVTTAFSTRSSEE
jgi:LAGLIDADG-like domain